MQKKRIIRYISIFMLIVVFIASFTLFTNKGYSTSVSFSDWGSIKEINNKYSYSTLFMSPNTVITDFTETVGESYREHENDEFKYWENAGWTHISPGDEKRVLITNCATNASGDLLDVVVTINNIVAFADYDPSDHGNKQPYAKFQIGAQYSIPYDPTEPKNDPNYSPIYYQQYNNPIVFDFESWYASVDFTMTYYKHGTYNDGSKSGELGGISAVSGIYWDLDIKNNSGDYANELFGGNEGFTPTVGNSIIYYDTNSHPNDTYKHVLQEYPGQGIAIADSPGSSNNVNAIYYESSVFMTTDSIDSTFQFRYSGTDCGINYMFASPYPYTIESPNKIVSQNTLFPGDSTEYTISQYVPNNYYGDLFQFHKIYDGLYETTRFNNLSIVDTIDNNYSIIGPVEVRDENGIDVSSYFSQPYYSGNVVTVSATAAALQNPNFYAHTYFIKVPVKLKETTANIGEIDNQANLIYSFCEDTGICPPKTLLSPPVKVLVKYRLNVNYYQDGSNTPVYPSEIGTPYDFQSPYNTSYEDKVDLRVWQYKRTDGDPTSGTMMKDTTVNYYFEKRPYTLTVNYLESGTNRPIDTMDGVNPKVTNPLYYNDPYSTDYNNVNLKKWRFVRSDGDAVSGNIEKNTVVNYYFEKIPYQLTVNYYEEGTGNPIATPDVTNPIYYDDGYKTNYDKIEHRMWRIVRSEVAEGEGNIVNDQTKVVEGKIVGNTTVNYYFEKIPYPVRVNYYDADTGEKIDETDETIYYFDMLYYTNYDKINMDVWEYVSTDGDPVKGRITGDQESYTINYYFNRLKYQLTVNYYDDVTKEKIDKSDRAAYNYGDEYDTNYDKIDENYWEYVRTEGETPGVIDEDKEVDYYFNNREYRVEVNYYDEETGEKIEETEVSSHKFGEEYTTNDDKIDKKKWELVEEPANKEGTVDGDIEVNYYYRKRKYKITVNYYEEGTENKIAESRESEAYYGDKYITDYNNVDGKVWELVGMPDNYQGEVDGDIVVNYYFRQVVIENPQTGSNMTLNIVIPIVCIITILSISIIIYRIYLKRKIYKI